MNPWHFHRVRTRCSAVSRKPVKRLRVSRASGRCHADCPKQSLIPSKQTLFHLCCASNEEHAVATAYFSGCRQSRPKQSCDNFRGVFCLQIARPRIGVVSSLASYICMLGAIAPRCASACLLRNHSSSDETRCEKPPGQNRRRRRRALVGEAAPFPCLPVQIRPHSERLRKPTRSAVRTTSMPGGNRNAFI